MPYKNKEEQRKYLKEWRARKKAEKLQLKPEEKPEDETIEDETIEERESNVLQPEEESESEEELDCAYSATGEEVKVKEKIPSTREKMHFWQFFLVAAGVPIITGLLSNFGNVFAGVSEYLKKK